MKHLISYTEPPADTEFHQRTREEILVIAEKIKKAGPAARNNAGTRGAWERSQKGVDLALGADSNTTVFVAEREGEYFFATAPAGKSMGAGGGKPMAKQTGHE